MKAPRGAWLIALATLIAHALTNGGYGWFRDELYFVACGRQPAWGYVDQPPLTPLLAAASAWASGPSALWLFRMPVALAHAGTVLITGLFAQQLGARAAGIALACIAAALGPALLAGGHLFTMNAFEPLLWTAAALLVARLLHGGDWRRLWWPLGALIGLGLLNKHSILFFATSLLVALLISKQRRILWSPYALAAALLASVLALPNALWQWRHGLPMLELLRNGQLYKNAPFQLREYLLGQLGGQGPLAALLAIAGLLWLLFAERARPVRALGLSFLVVQVLFVALHAKSYYATPAFPLLFAAGGAAFEALALPRLARAGAIGALALTGALLAPVVVPVVPPATLARWLGALHLSPARTERLEYNELPQHLADEHGWPRMARTVADAFAQLPAEERAGAVIFANNYGEAGALDLFGPALGLPRASSGHNQDFLWGPQGAGRVVLILGREERAYRRSCGSLTLAGTAGRDAWAMPYENDVPIWICRDLVTPLAALWPGTKHYE
jgi:4-amino-4-deoxy-L-arabinose transferase-like glycosyltransferase